MDDRAVAEVSPTLARHLEDARTQDSLLDRGILLRNLSVELADAGALDLALECVDEARGCYRASTTRRRRFLASVAASGAAGARSTRTPAGGLADCDHTEAYVLAMLDRHAESLELGLRASSEYLRLHEDHRALLAASTAASAAHRLGRVTELEAVVARGRGRALDRGDASAAADWAALLAPDEPSLGELEERFHRAIRDDDPLTVAGYAHALANAWVEHDDLEQARGYARTAVVQYAALPGDSLRDAEARVRWMLGTLELRCGDAEDAVRTLTEAERALRSLGLDDESDACAAGVVAALTQTRGHLVAAEYVRLRERARTGRLPGP